MSDVRRAMRKRLLASTSFPGALLTGFLAFGPAQLGASPQAAVDHGRDAQVVVATGQVTRERDHRPWALSGGDKLPVRQTITTGADGYAEFYLAGGSRFEMFSNSCVAFRQNAADPNDLVDVVSGRVRVHFQPPGGGHQRVFSPSVVISAYRPSTIALAIDEDDTVRIDVMEGEVRVRHSVLPGSEPVMVKAIDAIVVEKSQMISRRIDRGTLYRYTAKVLSAVTFGRSGNHDGEPIEQNKLADNGKSSDTFRLSF